MLMQDAAPCRSSILPEARSEPTDPSRGPAVPITIRHEGPDAALWEPTRSYGILRLED